MITFTCPSCSGKCQVGDEFVGRKMRCPKCGTRIRHHADGTMELLTVGAPPASAPSGGGAPASAPVQGGAPASAPVQGGAPASAPVQGGATAGETAGETAGQPPDAAAQPPVAAAEPSKKETTVQIGLVTEVAGKLLTQKESSQNALIAWGVVGFIAVALAAVGIVLKDATLAVAPIALALAAAFAWLSWRAKRRRERDAREKAGRPPKPAVKDEEKTEPLPKV